MTDEMTIEELRLRVKGERNFAHEFLHKRIVSAPRLETIPSSSWVGKVGFVCVRGKVYSEIIMITACTQRGYSCGKAAYYLSKGKPGCNIS